MLPAMNETELIDAIDQQKEDCEGQESQQIDSSGDTLTPKATPFS
jgi:hypothetical protein